MVLTNNPRSYAKKVLERVGLRDYFSHIFGLAEMELLVKPNPRAFQVVRNNFPHAEQDLFCDDSLENLRIARELGWKTIWFDPKGTGADAQGHVRIASFEEIRQLI